MEDTGRIHKDAPTIMTCPFSCSNECPPLVQGLFGVRLCSADPAIALVLKTVKKQSKHLQSSCWLTHLQTL